MRKQNKNVAAIESRFSVIRTLIGVGISLVIALILIAAVTDNPIEADYGPASD